MGGKRWGHEWEGKGGVMSGTGKRSGHEWDKGFYLLYDLVLCRKAKVWSLLISYPLTA